MSNDDLVLKLSGMDDAEKALLLKALLAQTEKAVATAAVKEVYSVPRVPPRFAALMNDLVELVSSESSKVEADEAFAFVIVYDGFQGKASRHVINLAKRRTYVDANKAEWSSLAQFVWSHGGTVDSIYLSRKASMYNRDEKTGKPCALKPKVAKSK